MPLTGSDQVDWIALARVNQGGMVKYREPGLDGGQPLPPWLMPTRHSAADTRRRPAITGSGPWVISLLPPRQGRGPGHPGCLDRHCC